jgi:hypothetical protein
MLRVVASAGRVRDEEQLAALHPISDRNSSF